VDSENLWADIPTRYVDDVLQGTNETLAVDVKFDLLKARLSGPGGNTTGADGLTRSEANATSNLNAASIIMDPLNFYQVSFLHPINGKLLSDAHSYSTTALKRLFSPSAICLKQRTSPHCLLKEESFPSTASRTRSRLSPSPSLNSTTIPSLGILMTQYRI
jgi:hypothetical protein